MCCPCPRGGHLSEVTYSRLWLSAVSNVLAICPPSISLCHTKCFNRYDQAIVACLWTMIANGFLQVYWQYNYQFDFLFKIAVLLFLHTDSVTQACPNSQRLSLVNYEAILYSGSWNTLRNNTLGSHLLRVHHTDFTSTGYTALRTTKGICRPCDPDRPT